MLLSLQVMIKILKRHTAKEAFRRTLNRDLARVGRSFLGESFRHAFRADPRFRPDPRECQRRSRRTFCALYLHDAQVRQNNRLHFFQSKRLFEGQLQAYNFVLLMLKNMPALTVGEQLGRIADALELEGKRRRHEGSRMRLLPFGSELAFAAWPNNG